MGFGFFYDFGSFGLKNDFGDKADAQAHSFGGYLAWHRDCDYFMFVGGGGFANYHATRYIEFESPDNTIARTAQGTSQGGQAAFYGEYGRNVQWENADLRPYLGLLYMNVLQKAFQETGAGGLDLSFDDSTINSFRTLLGGQLDFRYSPMANLVWTMRGVWMHEYVNEATAGSRYDGSRRDPGQWLLAYPPNHWPRLVRRRLWRARRVLLQNTFDPLPTTTWLSTPASHSRPVLAVSSSSGSKT